MRILSRHFLASYAGLFVTILLTSIVAIAIVELLLNFDEILDDHSGIADVAIYLFLRLPAYYFRDLIPVSSFAAVLFCVGLAARRQEFTAIKTGGISPYRMVLPILVAATVLSAASLLINETVVLSATRAWNSRQNPGEEITFRRGSFWYHRGDTIYSIAEADLDAKILRGVRVFDTGPRGRLRQSIRAEVVEVDEDHRWHLRDATIRTFSPANPTAPPAIEHREEKILAVAAERDLNLIEAGAQTLSLSQLREYIRTQRDEGRDAARYRGILNTRLADAMTVAVFALIAIPLGLAVERNRNIAAAAVIGIVILGLFYAVRTTASMLAASDVGSPALAPWLVLGSFAAFGMFRLARVPR